MSESSGRDGEPGLDGFLAPLDYPMFVVTAAHEGERSGCLVGFATQCSIDPERFLVCLSLQNRTHEVARQARLLAVHLLRSDQEDLAALFGAMTGDEVDKFARCRWRPGPEGVPILLGCPGWVVGRVLQRIPFGDHEGFLFEPVEAEGNPGPRLLTFAQVRELRPGHPA